MNEQSKNTDDFDRLLMTVIEDELSDDQRRKLFARLQADPDLRDRYGAIYFQMGRPGEARNHGQVSEGENVLGVQGAYEMSSGMTP